MRYDALYLFFLKKLVICEKKKMALEKCVKMTRIALFVQTKLVYQKHDAIMNPEMVLKLPNVLITICSLGFHFKVVVQVD